MVEHLIAAIVVAVAVAIIANQATPYAALKRVKQI